MTGRLVSLAGALSAVFVAAGSGLAAGVTLTAGHLTADSHAYGAAVTCTLSAAAADSYVAKELSGSNFGTQTTLIVSSAGVTTRRVFHRPRDKRETAPDDGDGRLGDEDLRRDGRDVELD